MKTIFGLVPLLLLSGCAHWLGPADGLVYLVGSTPGDSPCELSLAPVGIPTSSPRVVSGQFRERFMVGHSRKGHRAQLSCAGAVVSARSFKYGHDVNFAGDLPLAGRAP